MKGILCLLLKVLTENIKHFNNSNLIENHSNNLDFAVYYFEQSTENIREVEKSSEFFYLSTSFYPLFLFFVCSFFFSFLYDGQNDHLNEYSIDRTPAFFTVALCNH